MSWRGWGLSDIGRVRTINQDAFGIFDDLGMWIVADGMGGHPGGEIASRLAVETVENALRNQLKGSDRSKEPTCSPGEVLRQALEAANQTVLEYGRQHGDYRGLGTTIVAVHISPSPPWHATVAHAGDSRAYLLRDGALRRLTRDHSVVEDRIDLGIITRDQALTHPLRHVLTRAVGIETRLNPSIVEFEPMLEDILLLCSDGLTKMLSDEDIVGTVLKAQGSRHCVCKTLIDEANRRGGEDNTTVVMIQYDKGAAGHS